MTPTPHPPGPNQEHTPVQNNKPNTPTPRSIVICDTCRTHYSEHPRYLDNHHAALNCINAGHNTYSSGIARLQLPTLKHHQPAHTHQPPLTLF